MKRIAAVVICVLALCACVRNEAIDTEKRLYDSKTAYVGDNSAVGAILANIPGLVADGFELYTDKPPYGTGIYTNNIAVSDTQIDGFRRGATILMCLAENCDYVRLVNRAKGTVFYEITRDDAELMLGTSFAEYSASYDSFRELLLCLDTAEKDDGISKIILEQNRGGYAEGECAGEGHVLLGSKRTDTADIYYLVTTYGEYGFRDGRFVKVAGTGAIPARITVDPGNNLTEYRQPEDGDRFMPSLEALFPAEYIEAALDESGELYARCETEEQEYAHEYLVKINRTDVPIGGE